MNIELIEGYVDRILRLIMDDLGIYNQHYPNDKLPNTIDNHRRKNVDAIEYFRKYLRVIDGEIRASRVKATINIDDVFKM